MPATSATNYAPLTQALTVLEKDLRDVNTTRTRALESHTQAACMPASPSLASPHTQLMLRHNTGPEKS
ncbi:hypothetical protein BaRGS_00007598, partial [Batillaria attramentaria]